MNEECRKQTEQTTVKSQLEAAFGPVTEKMPFLSRDVLKTEEQWAVRYHTGSSLTRQGLGMHNWKADLGHSTHRGPWAWQG